MRKVERWKYISPLFAFQWPTLGAACFLPLLSVAEIPQAMTGGQPCLVGEQMLPAGFAWELWTQVMVVTSTYVSSPWRLGRIRGQSSLAAWARRQQKAIQIKATSLQRFQNGPEDGNIWMTSSVFFCTLILQSTEHLFMLPKGGTSSPRPTGVIPNWEELGFCISQPWTSFLLWAYIPFSLFPTP